MSEEPFNAYKTAYRIVLSLSEKNKMRYGCPVLFVQESELKEELKKVFPVFTISIFNMILQQMSVLEKIIILESETFEDRIIIPAKKQW